jgi:hypothetical protein
MQFFAKVITFPNKFGIEIGRHGDEDAAGCDCVFQRGRL